MTANRLAPAGLAWEVDVFEADNAGLVLVEIELPGPAHHIETPRWLGDEITDNPRYLDRRLATHPFNRW
ncbi:MAG: hypothetical protein AAF460_12810 [Pseudomonadota bacterium]